MKKLLTLLMMAAFSFMIISCDTTRDDRIDQDTYSVVYDLANVDFIYSAADGYTISRTMNIYNSDVLLMYRKTGTTSTGEAVWQQIPKTIYLAGGNELDYDFDFSSKDFVIYANGNYDISTTPQYINGQTFRIVIVPASFGTNKNAQVDHSDYNSVIKYYNIDDSKAVKL
ncbi:hypothetical protein EIZ47_10715 [Chryseobacterium lacus]|uniref:Lipoprotein n=1 Tax=Chryseobacterium lacus TaxID=2058346 RepID=A0A368MXV2_9FLAO|nr:hypothetical protein [Chryseobacterium lacus]RCU42165.1 hypothetical protein DQ356_10830 [Chryseobacterium lacus]RST26374.1 hypothetical protein EIZ47_10715 [Chryseobacterium lacus]